jgi:hypothetical protein
LKKKVLIITYYWPPSGGSGVQRWLKFVKYLPDFGWDPIVYTVENGEFPVIDTSLISDIPNGTIVIKKPIWEPFNIYNRLLGKKKGEKFGHGFAGEKNESGLKKIIKNFAIWVRGNYFIPDSRKFWIKPSVNFLSSYLLENSIEYLITTGPPHTCHVIGLHLKEKTNIKWIADFRDPWTGVYYFPELKLNATSINKHKKLERSVLLSADKVISVGKTLNENLYKLTDGKSLKNKFEIITNGFDKPLQENLAHPKEFNLVYTGLFSKDQNHEVLWKAIKYCCDKKADFNHRFRIDLYGNIDSSVFTSIETFGLLDKLTVYDHVPLERVSNIQSSAAILLLCINHYPGEKEMLTGKLFDYISSQRPILNIGPVDGDAAEIINQTQTGRTFSLTDIDGISEYLLNSFELFSKENLITQGVNLAQYHRKQLTKRLSEILMAV